MWKKVIGPTILVSLLWIAGSSISTFYIHRVYESHSRVLAENVSTMRAGWAMQDALWRIEAVVMEAGGKDHRETRIEVAELEAAFNRHLDEAEKTSFTPGELTLVKAVREHFAVYRDHIEARLKPAGLASLLTPQAADNEKTLRLARGVAEPCRQLIELNERMLADSTARSARLSTWVNLVRLAFLVAGPILGVLYGLWVARGLNRSISQISVTLKDAAGEPDREMGSVEVRARGDLPGLQQQVQIVAGRMRQVMEELQHTRRQAMSAERLAAVGELAAGIAHELRNPLTSVKLLVQTAQRQVRNESAGKQLQVVQQEIARLESTIQGLLDFARPPELHRVPHDLPQPCGGVEPGRGACEATGGGNHRTVARYARHRGRRSGATPSDIRQSAAQRHRSHAARRHAGHRDSDRQRSRQHLPGLRVRFRDRHPEPVLAGGFSSRS